MSKTFRRAAMSSICMLIVAVMSLTGATYAWFTSGEQATVSGMNVEVNTAAGGVQVREKTGDNQYTPWGTTLDLSVTAKKLEPVSSADGNAFFNIAYNPTDMNKVQVLSVDKASSANVIVKNIQLQNTGTQENVIVNLVDSAVSAVKNATTSLENEIYKAARVAIITSDVSYVWATGDEGATYYAFSAATPTSGENQYIPVNASVSGYTTTTTVATAAGCEITLPKATTDASEDGTYTPVDVQIVIWLEGQDTDCKNGNAGGAFDVVLNFKKKVTTPAQGN